MAIRHGLHGPGRPLTKYFYDFKMTKWSVTLLMSKLADERTRT